MKNVTDYMEKERMQTLLDYAQTCSSRDYLVLRILWRTDIRVSELLSIMPPLGNFPQLEVVENKTLRLLTHITFET